MDGRPLSDIVNEKHENVKYLAGVNIGDNVSQKLCASFAELTKEMGRIQVRAEPDISKAVEGATALIIVIPHQVRLMSSRTLFYSAS